MQAPIPDGTILQNRYRSIQVLGEGGFGRTYLAQDGDRFNEPCVLKEYNPNFEGTYALNKSKELFQREAQILYQIKHPQIPAFRATFEEQKRLFLVQDYVEGKSYRSLLDDRIEQKRTFTQKEMVKFLQQMLPVLAHIHDKGIIHRDISPDNIILRDGDCLPVLIDFGAVKDVAQTQLISSDGSEDAVQGTTVGKLGYSPAEQLQTGKVDATSDLYALAATAVVLMTGRKPQDLLDKSTMTWRWHSLVPTLNPRFGQLLNRMLSYRPENRYQSANEVANALRTIADLIIASPKPSPPRTLTPATSKPIPSRRRVSLWRTLWNLPWTGRIIGAGFVFLFAAVVFKSVDSTDIPNDRQGSSTGPQQIENQLGDPPQPPENGQQTSEQNNCTQVSPLPPYGVYPNIMLGQTEVDRRTIKASETYQYAIPGEPGQRLSASVNTEDVSMNVLNSNEQLIAMGVSQWQGTLTANETYYIAIAPVTGVCESEYQLTITVMPPS